MVPTVWVSIVFLLISSHLVCPMGGSYMTLPGGLPCVPSEGALGEMFPLALVFKGPQEPSDWGDPYV